MPSLAFSTAGVPLSASKPDTPSGIRRIAELGLDGMELEFVHGVRLSVEQAKKHGELAREKGLLLTAHGPYYVNLNAKEPEKLEKTFSHLLSTAKVASAAGALSFTFHPGFYLKDPRERVYATIKTRLTSLMEDIKAQGCQINVAPELTGKPSQFGSLSELLALCSDIPGLKLCVDFAHAYARENGEVNGYQDFSRILKAIRDTDKTLLSSLHMHVSGIEHGKSGEKKHLPLKESAFDYQGLLRALKDYEVGGVLVCESPILEQDALLLKELYYKL